MGPITHSFSALDRHAVLSGIRQRLSLGLPGAMLAGRSERSGFGLRCEKLSHGDEAGRAGGPLLMVSEKVAAAFRGVCEPALGGNAGCGPFSAISASTWPANANRLSAN